MKVTPKNLSKLFEGNYSDISSALSKRFGISLQFPTVKYFGELRSSAVTNLEGNTLMAYKHSDDCIYVSIGACFHNLQEGEINENQLIVGFGHEDGHRYHHHLNKSLNKLVDDHSKLWSNPDKLKVYNFFERFVFGIYMESVGYHSGALVSHSLGITDRNHQTFEKEELERLYDKSEDGTDLAMDSIIIKNALELSSDLFSKTDKEFQDYCNSHPLEALKSMSPKIKKLDEEVRELSSSKDEDDIANHIMKSFINN